MSSSHDSDPCAAPRDFVQKRIEKIRALQEPAARANASVFEMLNGKKNFDAQKSAEISDLRYDAEGVNALLAAGGCRTFDLEHELSARQK